MSYPWANNLLYRVTGNEPPAQAARQRPGSAPRPTARHGLPAEAGPASLGLTRCGPAPNSSFRRLEEPDLADLPPASYGVKTFTIDEGDGCLPDQRSQLTLDARTAELVRSEPFSSYNAGTAPPILVSLSPYGRSSRDRRADHCRNRRRGGMLVWTGICLPSAAFLPIESAPRGNTGQPARPGLCDEHEALALREPPATAWQIAVNQTIERPITEVDIPLAGKRVAGFR